MGTDTHSSSISRMNWLTLSAMSLHLFLVPFYLTFADHAMGIEITQTMDLEQTKVVDVNGMLEFKDDVEGEHSGTQSLYGYDGGLGTGNWDGLCSTGTSQSPVDINNVKIILSTEKIHFAGARQIPISTRYSNSGQTVKIKLVTPEPIRMWGGPFGDTTYELQQMHFHWGQNTSVGSEHTAASKSFSAEIHLVFYKAGVKDVSLEKNGIAVLAVLYKGCSRDNVVLRETINSIDDIIEPLSEISKRGGTPLFGYLPRNLLSYFHYVGSLTTPPCTEGVSWVVFTSKLYISERQVSQLRKIKDYFFRNILFNFRETKRLNGRTVGLVNGL